MDYNYKKRDYLLPKGCKDLIDVLKPGTKPVQHKPVAAVAPWPLPPIIGEMKVPAQMTVRDLAEALKKKPFQVIADLMEVGVFANVLDQLDFETISKVVRKYGYVARTAI